MAEGAFADRTVKPAAQSLARELGRAWGAWQALSLWLAEHFAPLTEEWRYPGEQWGWSLRVKRKKRTILYLLPCRKYFGITLILGDKAVNRAIESGLPAAVAREIRQAKRYPEGRAVRFEIRSKKDLPAIVRLVEAKMST